MFCQKGVLDTAGQRAKACIKEYGYCGESLDNDDDVVSARESILNLKAVNERMKTLKNSRGSFEHIYRSPLFKFIEPNPHDRVYWALENELRSKWEAWSIRELYLAVYVAVDYDDSFFKDDDTVAKSPKHQIEDYRGVIMSARTNSRSKRDTPEVESRVPLLEPKVNYSLQFERCVLMFIDVETLSQLFNLCNLC